MEIGQTYSLKSVVKESQLACQVGSGCVSVFATPMMIALVEQCAAACVQGDLPEGDSTVGTLMNMTHSSATPVGMEVGASATITAIEGRTITFAVKAWDACGPIGEGVHQRVIIHVDRFNQKAAAKGQPA